MSEHDTVPGTPGPWEPQRKSTDELRRPEFLLDARLHKAAPALYNALRHFLRDAVAEGWEGKDIKDAHNLISAIDPHMRPWPMREGEK